MLVNEAFQKSPRQSLDLVGRIVLMHQDVSNRYSNVTAAQVQRMSTLGRVISYSYILH